MSECERCKELEAALRENLGEMIDDCAREDDSKGVNHWQGRLDAALDPEPQDPECEQHDWKQTHEGGIEWKCQQCGAATVATQHPDTFVAITDPTVAGLICAYMGCTSPAITRIGSALCKKHDAMLAVEYGIGHPDPTPSRKEGGE